MNNATEPVYAVIGGTSGIGRAVADALETRPGVVEIASRATGLDISDEASVAEYFQQLGSVDHVVITAGSKAPGGTVADVDIGEAKAAFDTKFWGAVGIAKHAMTHIRSGGSLTLTSGFLARRTVPGIYVKTAMNAAIESVAKVLARELAPVCVNVVSPGLTRTEAYARLDPAARTAMFEGAADRLPVGRVGTPQDLAQAYLLAIDNPFVTAAVIDVDGGTLVN